MAIVTGQTAKRLEASDPPLGVDLPLGVEAASDLPLVVELPAGTQKARPSGADPRTAPRTGLLNVRRQMACLLLWVARFSFPDWFWPWAVLFGAFALFQVLCASWATTREPVLSSGFDDEDAVLNRCLSTPVYVREFSVRLHTGWFLSGSCFTGCPWCRSSCVCCVYVHWEASRWYTSRPSSLCSTSLLLHFRSPCFRYSRVHPVASCTCA